jgi:hypothetical protein
MVLEVASVIPSLEREIIDIADETFDSVARNFEKWLTKRPVKCLSHGELSITWLKTASIKASPMIIIAPLRLL